MSFASRSTLRVERARASILGSRLIRSPGVLPTDGLGLMQNGRDYFRKLRDRFVRVAEEQSEDEFPARVFCGGVAGLYTIMEGVIMRGDGGQLWVAFIDDTVVRYFTTEHGFKNRLPRTIEKWREPFKNIPVDFDSLVSSIPTDF